MEPNKDSKSLSPWQIIFLRSKVNGAPYRGEYLLGHSWNWPENTYLQRRLNTVRYQRLPEELTVPDLNALCPVKSNSQYTFPRAPGEDLIQSM